MSFSKRIEYKNFYKFTLMDLRLCGYAGVVKRARMVLEVKLLPHLSLTSKESCGLVPTQVRTLLPTFILKWIQKD